MARKEVPFDPMWAVVNGSRGPVHVNGLSLDVVKDAVEALPEELREVIERLFWERMTLEAYGAELGISKQAVRKRKERALEALKEVLNGEVGSGH